MKQKTIIIEKDNSLSKQVSFWERLFGGFIVSDGIKTNTRYGSHGLVSSTTCSSNSSSCDGGGCS